MFHSAVAMCTPLCSIGQTGNNPSIYAGFQTFDLNKLKSGDLGRVVIALLFVIITLFVEITS